jgi:NADH-quinone oxidoreductase subunit L
MWGPLVPLAIASAVVGFLNVPHVIPFPVHGLFEHYLRVEIPPLAKEHWERLEAEFPAAQEFGLMAVSVVATILAAGFAWMLYGNGFSAAAQAMQRRFPRVHRTLSNKYYVDEFYFGYIVDPLRDMSLFLWRIVDVVIIDGIVNGVGQACQLIGGLTSFRMSGSLHRHGMTIVVGLICMLTVLLF